jgi:hypothetical protein
VRGVGVAFLARHRGDVDDPAVLVGDHLRHDRAAHQVGRDQVDLDDATPDVGRELPGGGVAAGDAGVVDQDVDLAMRLGDAFGRGGDVGLAGQLDHVGADAAGLAELALGLGELLAVRVPQGDRGARGEHALGDGVADALRAAGDDGDAALQVDPVHEGQSLSAPPRRPASRGSRRCTGG